MPDDTAQLRQAALLAYALTPADIAALAAAIAAARLSAYAAAFAATFAAADLDLSDDWEPDPAVAQGIAAAAQLAAEGVAHTYQRELAAHIDAFFAAWGASHPTGADPAPALARDLAAWTAQRRQWKAQQIASVESAAGADMGVAAALAALLGQTDASHLVVAVVPDWSSPDDCADYAGNVYPLDLFDTLPEFPMHPNCVHQRVVLPDGDWEAL